jgi:hypothetical protein
MVGEVNVAASKGHWKDPHVSEILPSDVEHVVDFALLMRSRLDILVNQAVKVPRCPKVSQGVPRCPKVSQGVPRCPKVSQGVPRCPKVSQKKNSFQFSVTMTIHKCILYRTSGI